MGMKKADKEISVENLHKKMAKATFVATASHFKLDALTDIELRKAMRNSKIDYKVVKNTLAKRAAKGTSAEKLTDTFKGPVAVVMGYEDVVQAAKSVTEALKKAPEAVKLKGAVAEGAVMDAKGVEALSKMPGLNELRAKLLGMLKQPATRIAQVINAPAGSLARVLQAHIDKAGEGQKAA